MTVRPIARRLVFALLAAGALIITGCSSSPSAAPSTTTKPAPPTSVASPGASIPFHLVDNARADVSTSPCVETPAGWVLKGTVKNSAKEARRFQIVVDFVTKVGSTVLATTVLNLPSVPPGATADWSATGAPGKPDVNCLVRLAQSI